MGFAVPIEIAKRVVPELLAYGEVRRGWIDISPVQLFSSLVHVADLPVSEGVPISAVKPNSPAAKAGRNRGRNCNPGRSPQDLPCSAFGATIGDAEARIMEQT